MRQSTRLIINSVVTYSRMVVTVGIGLLITRLLIRTLGISDFGLLTALGASGILLSILRDAFTASGTRFMAHAIGNGDEKLLQSVFASSLWMHILAALASAVIGVVMMPLILKVAEVPPDRQIAAWWVLGSTVFGLVAALVATPYTAMITAHQEIPIRTAFELAGRIVALGVVLALVIVPTDRLATYAVLSVGATLTLEFGLVLICIKRYPACRQGLANANWRSIIDQVSFGGWNVLGSMIIRLRMQGTIFLLNIFFGTVVNAAFAIAVQAASYQSKLIWAMMSAIRPAMTTMYGRSGQSQSVIQLVCMANKFPYYISLLVFIPAVWETELLLDIWLGEYPVWTPLFIRLTMLTVLVNTISNGYTVLMSSRGELRGITLLGLTFQICAIAAGWLGIIFANWGPAGFLWAALATTSAWSLLRVLYVGKLTGLLVSDYLLRSALPIAVVTAVAFTTSGILFYFVPEGLLRLGLITLFTMIAVCLACWSVGMTSFERYHFSRILIKTIDLVRVKIQQRKPE